MSISHGVTIIEQATQLITMTPVETGIVIAIGTAPQGDNKAHLIYKMSEFKNVYGWSDEDEYTLCGAANAIFNLYNVAPAIFINAVDATKHFNTNIQSFGGVENTPVEIEGFITNIIISTGDVIKPEALTAGTDYTVEESEDSYILTIKKLGLEKIHLEYKYGEHEYSSDITLDGTTLTLPSDTEVESVVVTTVGVNTFKTLTAGTDYTIKTVGDVNTITVLTEVVDDTILVMYDEIDATKVSDDDIISAIEEVESIQPRFNLAGNFSLIAPKYSLSSKVAAALTSKAKGINGLYPCVALVDIEAASYTDAVETKNSSNLSDSHLIVCYPRVLVDGKVDYLSTHIAALMNQVDADNDNIPFVSPSNKTLQISGACLSDGTEVYYSQSQANLLNANGIVTTLSRNGIRAWGNYTSAFPASGDVKDYFIPVRRMFNFIMAELLNTYISQVDFPINRRTTEGILQSLNIWLGALVNKGALLGARAEFNEDDNPATDLMAGILHFRVYICPPSPLQTLCFEVELDTSAYSSLF